MSLMKWSDNYSVQVPEMDQQHKKLIGLVNTLHDAMAKGKAGEVMAGILQELIAYTRTHFSDEETLMRSNNYPEFQAHQAEHHAFVEKVLQVQKGFAQGHVTVRVEIMNFLCNWINDHIMKSDKGYGHYLSQPH